ncbi:MAG TPA: hypothetical protein VHL59_15870, partial [Thermoanaerobaculia bacterium]|nr:hypothetical protein [Thermoanaerobaculia bacterium]
MSAILHRGGVERLARTRIVEILGGGMFAEVTAVRVPGRVVWCNYELAREIGFDVPAWPRMTRALHQQLVDALSYRALQPGEEADGRPTITLHADRYGGDGIAPYLGSARAAFAPWGDILLKGIGLTPLFQTHNEDDFPHSHGRAVMDESFVEALQCEVAFHLFSRTPARILAIVDQDEIIDFPDGRRFAGAVLARAGLQLRPAHVLAHDALRNRWCRDVFVRITRETGQLVERDGLPDLKATMLRVIDDQAGAVAEQVRWRVTHGCISTSNMLMSGGMLDLVLQTTHPRLAGIAPAEKKNPERLYFRDYEDRVRQMGKVYRALRKNMSADERGQYRAGTIDARNAMSAAYRDHLDQALLCAAGLKAEAARRVRSARPEVARRFTDVLLRMGDLKNPASVEEAESLIERHAVLHVHQLLRNFPRAFFAAPDADHRRVIHRELHPIYRGNRHHVARKRRAVKRLIREFASAFAELMPVCAAHAADCYENARQMRE